MTRLELNRTHARLMLLGVLGAGGCALVGGITERELAVCTAGESRCVGAERETCDPDGLSWSKDGVCEVEPPCGVAPGEPIPDPTPGDCRALVCVDGVVTEVPDDGDLVDDGDACTFESCEGGTLLPGDTYPCRFSEGVAHAFTCVIRGDGQVWCWGKNDLGQLGRGGAADSFAHPEPAPVDVPPARLLMSGMNHSCAVGRDDGRLRCWGGSSSGQIAGSTEPTNTTPLLVDLGQEVVDAAGSTVTTCAVLEDTTIRCWGDNTFGQLGDGTTISRSTPAPVLDATGAMSLTGAVEVVANAHATCARLENGEVWCWGTSGFLGDGSLMMDPHGVEPLPVKSGLPFPALQLGAGEYHTLAVLDSGDVACWGLAGMFECATSIAPPFAFVTPHVIPLQGAVKVAGGWRSTCALGDVALCWGSNHLGALGIGANPAPGVTAIDPTPVVGLPADVEDLGVFWQHACARAGKDLYCWGSNLSGALGNGTTTDSNVAVKVAWP